MRSRTAYWLGPIFLLSCSQIALANGFTISQWMLGVGVEGPGSGSDGSHAFMTVTKPFQASHTAGPAASTCQASYDFAWAEQFGTFLIQSTQAAEGVPTSLLFTAASGYIYVTPSQPLALAIDAEWTFHLPRYYMDTTLLVSVYGVNSHVSLFSETTGGQTSYPDPASGTVTITGNVILPPGETWVLRYDMNIKTFSGTQGHTATGSGYVNFQLSPEPASVALVALGLLILTRCRHYAP